jgi:SAM-dependent methyltransferase
MKLTKAPSHDWVEKARAVWERKPGLRDYYQTQIFERILSEMNEGKTLQLGAGAGFFSQYHSGMTNTDIAKFDGVDLISDVHSLQFHDASFDNIVGIDVLHHFASPGLAMKECARTLRPGGRIILVEPWVGLLGWFFYKYIHHEDCFNVEDP